MIAAVGSVAGHRAWAAPALSTVRESIDLAGSSVDVTRSAVQGAAKRPTVLLLHGSKGLEAHRRAYEGYARDLAGLGIDTMLVSYLRPDDLAAIDRAQSVAQRRALYARSVDGWVSLVRGLAARAREGPGSSGHVGLLGFSLGGMVAVAAAGDPVFSVLTVFYAALPGFYHHSMDRLPPLLDLHGAADRSIPVSQGSRLVAEARRLGGVGELAVYANQGHGFDLDPANPDAAPARQRATSFIAHWIAPS